MNERKCPVSRQEAEALFDAVQNSTSRDNFAVSGANALAEEFGMSCRITAPMPNADDVNERCQEVMRARGKVYPRTCYVCGLRGPCVTSAAKVAAIAIANERGEG